MSQAIPVEQLRRALCGDISRGKNGPQTPAIKRVDPVDALHERATARAFLWSIGEYDLPEAVDALQVDAVRDGLVERIGQDAVQTILADAFRPFRRELTS